MSGYERELLVKRDELQAEVFVLIAKLQSATERLPCGHWKGDSVGAGPNIAEPAYCRTCAEISERTAAAMAAQKLADAQIGSDFDNMDGKEFHAKYGQVDCGLAIHATPLASAESQKWLEEHDEFTFQRGVKVACEMMEIHISTPPTVQRCTCPICKGLTRQLAAARAEAYRHCAAQLPYDHWARTAFEKQATEAESLAKAANSSQAIDSKGDKTP